MKLSRRRYYWLVLAGLLLGLVSGILGARYEEAINSNLGLMLGMLVILFLTTVLYWAGRINGVHGRGTTWPDGQPEVKSVPLLVPFATLRRRLPQR